MKIIHITDTHFVRPGATLYGLDPRGRLDAAIADINANHADAELAVITGDLAHWGQPEAYENLADCLSALAVPFVPLVGNHDEREAFRVVFADAPLDEAGFVQAARQTPAGTFLFLDTIEAGDHAGRYCDKRLGWLERQFERSTGPLFLFMHHPPFKVGLEPLDGIGIVNAEALRAVVAPHAGRIRHLFYGHIHRPICGSWLGIPASTIRGTNHQTCFDMAARGSVINFNHEEPAYAVFLIDDDTVVGHTHDYLYAGGIYASNADQTGEGEDAAGGA